MIAKKLQVHPFLLFWVGVLTGALVIGLLFLYRIYGTDWGTNVFRSLRYATPTYQQTVQTNDLQNIGTPPSFAPQDTQAIGNPPSF